MGKQDPKERRKGTLKPIETAKKDSLQKLRVLSTHAWANNLRARGSKCCGKKNHNVEPRPKTMQRIEVQESKTFGLPIMK